MLPEGFEPTISAGERPQTYTLDRAATGTDDMSIHPGLKPYFTLLHVKSVANEARQYRTYDHLVAPIV